jgi:protection-of-telomeres protein 1
MPKVQRIGDIIIIRRVQNKGYAGSFVLLSNWQTKSTVYPADKIPDPGFGAVAYAEEQPQMLELKVPLKPNPVSPEERLYVIHLRQWALKNLDLNTTLIQNTTRLTNAAPSSAPRGPGQKLSLLKDVKDAKYYDLIGEVRKFWTEPRSGDIYITDYTANSLFFDYQRDPTENENGQDGQDGDTYNYTESHNTPKTLWLGPFGKMSLQVHLWPPHNAAVVEVGDYVFIKNALVRFRNGKYLEATLHQDRKNEDQIDVRKLSSTDERLAPLLQRRKEHLAKENERVEMDGKHRTGGGIKSKLSNAEKKKLKRARKQQAAAETMKKAKFTHGEGETLGTVDFFEPKVSESTKVKANRWLNENGNVFTSVSS